MFQTDSEDWQILLAPEIVNFYLNTQKG